MTYAMDFFWLFFGASVVFWTAAALFGVISRKFVYPGKGDSSPRLIFQITTRDCPGIVDRAVASIRKSCAETGFTNYDIWAVTTNRKPKLGDARVRRVIVPEEFQTVAKFKARSMEYARRLRAGEAYSGWVYFMDEENWITGQTVRAVTNFAAHGNSRLASGPLVFRNGGSYWAWLGDSVRNSEGRISCLLHSIGFWPLHGDNLLVEFGVEKEVGWEFTGLTEDVQFTAHALARGYRTGWHGGELQTMSPASLADFIKQRRRWFRGMVQCILSRNVGPGYKLLQAYILLTGLMGTFVFSGITADLIFNISPFAREWYFSLPAMAIFAFAFFAGCRSNLKDKAAAALFCWLFSLFEGASAWGGVIRPPKSFDIIKKK